MKHINLGGCQIEGCANLARFGLYHTRLFSTGRVKTWKYVCENCEAGISHENLLRARRDKSHS